MELIPAIDLRDGKCVRLFQGDYGRETVYSEDPLSTANRWVGLGAARLHVVDLDGARDGVRANASVVSALCQQVRVPIQLGGGIRDARSAGELLHLGVDRVVFGTAAVEAPGEVRLAVQRFGGDRIVVGVDARDGVVATRGWTSGSGVPVKDLLAEMRGIGVKRFMYTDISRDGTLTHPNFDSIADILGSGNDRIIAAGGIASTDDLVKLAELGVEAAVIGQALYTGAVDLQTAARRVAETG